MKYAYHEIALEFEKVLMLLPLEKLSGEILCKFLPPPQSVGSEISDDNEFW